MAKLKKVARLAGLAMVVGASSMVSGCATVFSGTTQDISVRTTPTDNAKCELSNDKGDATISSTPGSAIVHRSGNSLLVVCEKNGVKTSHTVYSDFNEWVIGDLVFFDILGLGIDFISGAAHKYPESVSVSLDKK